MSAVCWNIRSGTSSPRALVAIDQYLEAEQAVITQEGRNQDVHERRIMRHSPHFTSLPLLVAQSDMIMVVPLAVARIYARLLQLKILPVPFAAPAVELKPFWHRRAHGDPANIWLRRQVADLFIGREPTGDPHSHFGSRYTGPA